MHSKFVEYKNNLNKIKQLFLEEEEGNCDWSFLAKKDSRCPVCKGIIRKGKKCKYLFNRGTFHPCCYEIQRTKMFDPSFLPKEVTPEHIEDVAYSVGQTIAPGAKPFKAAVKIDSGQVQYKLGDTVEHDNHLYMIVYEYHVRLINSDLMEQLKLVDFTNGKNEVGSWEAIVVIEVVS